ncbi:PaaX family transcriptional regulator C-terminal domain-containing protein [Microbacterium elymi]|uniref:Transcriptional repressor PaaX-like C-terminal domain-containing protein n=1 Tax=Microbacterium elymi TaxID=2909587 RepID=A0ABY5NHV3_9MICO|nr:PaaX family transcriptional regulator C-terminal domain-containing protein [Microbacterium elymi]UUT34676.1 hypothetical protein L2X98_29800 [Microbacterium elymi]
MLLTAGGRKVLEQMAGGDLSIDDIWDGQWVTVRVRRLSGGGVATTTRSRLLLETMGSLGNGLWIAPHSPRAAAAMGVLAADPELDVVAGVMSIVHPDPAALVEEAWDLESVRRVYAEFTDVVDGLHPGTDEDVLAAWITVRRQWTDVLRADPELPSAALPADWPGVVCRKRVSRLHDDWWPVAKKAFDRLM